MNEQRSASKQLPLRSNSVAVVIPLHTVQLDQWAMLALQSAQAIFFRRSIIFVAPRDVAKSSLAATLRARGFVVIELERHYFVSRSSYNSMLFRADFFRMFTAFNYILVFQLDALALRDTLDYWVSLDYDFIGAPLRRNYGRTKGTSVGPGLNGGLSLRRVDSALRVLESSRGRRIRMRDAVTMERHVRLWSTRTFRDGLCFNFSSLRRSPKINEDLFWSYFVPRANTWFRVPDADVARRFAFDAANGWSTRFESSEATVGIHAVHRLPPEDFESVTAIEWFGHH